MFGSFKGPLVTPLNYNFRVGSSVSVFYKYENISILKGTISAINDSGVGVDKKTFIPWFSIIKIDIHNY